MVAVGLGAEPTGALPAAETLRRAAASAVRALAGTDTVALALPVDGDSDTAPDAAALRGVAEGALLGTYRFGGYKSTPARRLPVGELIVHVPDAGARPSAHGRDRARRDRGGGGRAYP